MIDAPPPLPPPPIIRTVAQPLAILESIPGIVRCGNGLVEPVRIERPFPAATLMLSEEAGLPSPSPAALLFDIDASGRPVSIRMERSAMPVFHYGSVNDDLAPALAVSRFPAAARVNCRISYTPQVTRLDDADPALIARFLAFPWNRQDNDRLAQRLAPSGSTCADPPKPRTLVYPDFEKLKVPLGTWLHTVLAFDVTADGAPANVRRLVGESGALEAEASRAIAGSRFAPEAKAGCTAVFGVPGQTPTPAPEIADKPAFRNPKDGSCERVLAEIPEVEFPDNFRKRAVEGWAVIRYSLAPWGAVGAVEVIEAQPAAAFGESARQLMQRAKGRELANGRTGCTQRIRFETTDKDMPKVILRDPK